MPHDNSLPRGEGTPTWAVGLPGLDFSWALANAGDSAPDLVHEGLARARRGTVHAVVGEIEGTRIASTQRLHAAHQHHAAGIAGKDPHDPPRRAVTGDHPEQADVAESGGEMAVLGVVGEGDARSPDAIDPALQHGRHGKPPVRETEDKAVHLLQGLDVALDRMMVVVVAHVGPPLLDRHHRVEAFAIEVGGDHPMPVLLQGPDDGAKEGVVITLGERMTMNDLDQHDAYNAGARGVVASGLE